MVSLSQADNLLHLGTSPPESCPYLPNRQASLSYSSMILGNPQCFDELLARGYRRNGLIFYKPDCLNGCRECVPIRIPVRDLHLSKSQRRLLKKFGGIFKVDIRNPFFSEEHLELFNRHAKHVSPKARALTERQYVEFLIESPIETIQLEFRARGRLVGIGFLDRGVAAASSVYFYWDPDSKNYSPGTFSSLWEILWCRDNGYRFYYLGYWIRRCPRMSYKKRFRPYEVMDWETGQWARTL